MLDDSTELEFLQDHPSIDGLYRILSHYASASARNRTQRQAERQREGQREAQREAQTERQLAPFSESPRERQVWQDRLTELEGSTARELVNLYGELLAYGWLEQNTGATPTPRRGAASGCYRITAAGNRAFKALKNFKGAQTTQESHI